MMIRVYCDGVKVYVGEAIHFLEDNNDDQDVKKQLEEVEEKGFSEFWEISGHWVINKITYD